MAKAKKKTSSPKSKKAAAAKPKKKKAATKPKSGVKKIAKKSPKPKKAAAKSKSAPKPSTTKRRAAKAPAKSGEKSARVPVSKPVQSKEKEKQVAKVEKPKQSRPKKLPFSINDHVVYPTHGVGKITALEEREVSGMHLEMFVVEFEKDKMILRVPVNKIDTTGMRKLASAKVMEEAMTTLKGRARIKRTMWSRRAQEYEAKINSGDPIAIAEVVRDLHRNANQPEQSYSERQIYEAALDRLVREVAAVEKIDEDSAQDRLQKVLQAA